MLIVSVLGVTHCQDDGSVAQRPVAQRPVVWLLRRSHDHMPPVTIKVGGIKCGGGQ